MKRAGVLLAVLATMLMSASVYADGSNMKKADKMNKMDKMGQMKKGEMSEKNVTVKGEIVDMGCYLSHEAHGAAHKSCAQMCLNNGMPMGLLTNDGTLYLLTLNHDNADPFNKAKTMAAETVSITGPVHARNGMKSIEVTEISQVTGKQTTKNN